MLFRSLLGAFSLRFAYKLERYLNFPNIIVLLYGSMALLYIAMAIFTHPIFLVLAYIALQGLEEMPAPIVSDYIHHHTETGIRSTVVSGISLSAQIVKLFYRAGLGILVGVTTLSNTFAILGVYLLVALGFIYWLLVRCGCIHKTRKEVGEVGAR